MMGRGSGAFAERRRMARAGGVWRRRPNCATLPALWSEGKVRTMRASRLLPAFVLLGAMLAGTACAAESPKALAQKPAPAAPSSTTPSLAHLEKWVGRYPYLDEQFTVLPRGKRFFDDPVLVGLMKQKIPPRIIETLATGWDDHMVSVPIEKVDGMLIVNACKEHECFSFNATLFIHLLPIPSHFTVESCWTEYDRKAQRRKDFWIGNKTTRLEGDFACSWKGGGIEAYKKIMSERPGWQP